MDFRKSGRFCTGKCVKFSYIYIKNAIIIATIGKKMKSKKTCLEDFFAL